MDEGVEKRELVLLDNPLTSNKGTSTRGRVGLLVREYETHYTFLLCHNIPEYATEWDLVTEALPYRLVICGELYGVVLKDQVLKSLGEISVEERERLKWVLYEPVNEEALPLSRFFDPRREWLEKEFEVLCEIRDPAHQLLLG